jgi:hypothetical protein
VERLIASWTNRNAPINFSPRSARKSAKPAPVLDGGQFPILDLIGNLRDETVGKPALAAAHSACTGAWEKMVRIVESGQPFSPENIEWLNGLLADIEKIPRLPVCRPRPSLRRLPRPSRRRHRFRSCRLKTPSWRKRS